jgi:tetratricopeptide (TPR) repeat protein
VALRQTGARERARAHLRRAIVLEPGAREALAELELEAAGRSQEAGDDAAALAHYRAAIEAQPGSARALWGAAWLLATQPGSALGEPAEAVELAERAIALGAARTPTTLEVLAASYAAAGDLVRAQRHARQARARLEAKGQPVPARLTRALAGYASGERLRLP